MSRRLVPMPPRNKALAPRQPIISPPRRAVPPLGWPPKNYDVAALIWTVAITAVLWEYRHVIFLIAMIYVLGRAWFWLCRRHPLAALFIFGFMQGLLGGRRSRRW